MKRFYKPIPNVDSNSPLNMEKNNNEGQPSAKKVHVEMDLHDPPADPGMREQMAAYHFNDREKIRRIYLMRGPFQPKNYTFPQVLQSGSLRRFNPKWFDDYHWLEYSIKNNAAYCLWCYLFKPEGKDHVGSCDAFVINGFKNWKRKEKLDVHVGGPNSYHNQARKASEDLMNQRQHIENFIVKQSEQQKVDYRLRLNASIIDARFLLRQGLAFRDHDETHESNNQGNFLELLKMITEVNEDYSRVCLDNSPGNLKLVSSDIQKDIVSAYAIETTKLIIEELGDAMFSILVDEACDVSTQEQMAIVIRFVDKRGYVIERLLGIIHVTDTTARSLKVEIEALLSKHNLSIFRLRGQGYDGASNMQGEFNGLKALILKDNKYAYFVHCFAHQLQLALVAVAKKNMNICCFFDKVSSIVNVVGGSCKHRDMLHELRFAKVRKAFEDGLVSSGQGLNQQTILKRAADTRWSSHYGSLISLIAMFSSVIDLLDLLVTDTKLSSTQRLKAHNILQSIQSFEFVFSLHLMCSLLGITDELSQALQRRDQDIVNAMRLIKISKDRIQSVRDHGWDNLLDEVFSFCCNNKINVPDMNERYITPGRARRNVEETTTSYHFQVEIFYQVVDLQLQELNNRFNEVNTELLLCLICLSPSESFSSFDKKKLIRLAELYSGDFPSLQLSTKYIDNQLETYIIDVRSDDRFVGLQGIDDLAKEMVQTKKHILYPCVYKLILLALTLPVTTTNVERAFSAMKIVKTRLRNKMADQFLADCLITFVEKEIFSRVDNETIMNCFQSMKSRRGRL